MPRNLLLLGVLLTALVGAGFLFLPGFVGDKNGMASAKPLVEVLQAKVFLLLPDEKISRELKTGDEVYPGDIIETDSQGLAAIHFPDGSVVRLDVGTKIVIHEASFDQTQNSLVVRLGLKGGRVWSRILQLVNPTVLWEVKTPNAVATVRGTAFGVQLVLGDTLVLVDRDSLEVKAIDPATQGPIPAIEPKKIEAGQVVEIREKDLPALLEARLALTVKPTPPELSEAFWVRRNKTQDIELDLMIEEFRKKGLKDDEIREKLRQKVFDINVTSALPSAEDIPASTRPKVDEKIEKAKPSVSPSPPTSGVIPRGLEIVALNKLVTVPEGSTLNFQAFLVMSDGTRRDVTKEASWQVIGSVGGIRAPGVFLAKLGADVSELGQAPGQVAAVWKDPASSKEFLGATPIFTVTAVAQLPLEREG